MSTQSLHRAIQFSNLILKGFYKGFRIRYNLFWCFTWILRYGPKDLTENYLWGLFCPTVYTRLVKNLKNANLILTSNFEVFWGLSSKNLKIIGSNLSQSLNLKPKTTTLILTSNFEAFWGFFKINLKYFSLPSTSKKPQTFFEVFLEDPRKPHTVHKIHQAFKTQGRL